MTVRIVLPADLNMDDAAVDADVQGFGESVLDAACAAFYDDDVLLGFLTSEGVDALYGLGLIR